METTNTMFSPISLDEIVEMMKKLRENEETSPFSAYAVFEIYSFNTEPQLRVRVYNDDVDLCSFQIRNALTKREECIEAFAKANEALSPERRIEGIKAQISALNEELIKLQEWK